MADPFEGGGKEFQAFLKSMPTIDEAASEDSVTVSGLAFRSTEGKFALTTGEGQTYDLDLAAVQRFKVVDSSGLTPVITVQLARDAFNKATLRPIKPIIKDVIKDVIKDIIHDHKLPWKDVIKDPIRDTLKELPKDPIRDTFKEVPKDPIRDTFKEIPKDPIRDTWWETNKQPFADPIDPTGTGIADTAVEQPGAFDPGGAVVNPAAGFGQDLGAMAAMGGDMTPFIMATPHQAPDFLVSQQMGAQPGMAAQAAPSLKPVAYDTVKEIQYETLYQFDRPKHFIADTRKEMIFDTRKEMIWDTWVEQGPFTRQEATFDPGNIVTQPPVWGFPGHMM